MGASLERRCPALVVAQRVPTIVLSFLLVAAQWLLNKGFGPGNVAGLFSSGIFCAAPRERGHFYLVARHSLDLRKLTVLGSGF